MVRPDLGHVEDVPLVGLSILRVHDLHVDVPGRVVLFLNGVVQILQEEVWVLSRDFGGFLRGEGLDTLRCLDVHFDVFERAILKLLH